MTHVNVINYRTSHFASTLSIFNYLQISLENFAFFTLKSGSVKGIKLSPKVYFKWRKNPSVIFRKTIGLWKKNTVFEKNVLFLKQRSFKSCKQTETHHIFSQIISLLKRIITGCSQILPSRHRAAYIQWSGCKTYIEKTRNTNSEQKSYHAFP